MLCALTLTKKTTRHHGVTLRRFFGHTKRTPNILPKLFIAKLSHFLENATELHTVRAPTPTSEGPILVGARPMHNSRDVTICVLSDLMRPPVFVKLNAIEGLGGGAFTFSIFSFNLSYNLSSIFFSGVLHFHIKYAIILGYNE